MSYNSILAQRLEEMTRLNKLFPSEFDAKYGVSGGSGQQLVYDYSELDKPFNVKSFSELYNESETSQHVKQTDVPWQSARQVKIHFFWGDRGCLPLNEYIYSENGLVQVKDVYDGMPILGGYVKKPYVFEDDVYELEINKTKFKASGEHPLWVRKYNQFRKNKARGQWITIDEINKHYQTKSQGKTRWYVKRYHENHFNFNEIAIGKPLAKLLGYLMSDGTFSEKQSVKFTNVRKELLEEVVSLSMEIANEFGISVKSYSKGNGQDLVLTGKHGNNFSVLKEKLRELGVIDRTTFGKLQLLQKDELIEFMKGYFNGDGCLYTKKHPVITFYSGIHERQAYELQFMLWRLGIKGFVDFQKRKDDHKGCWEVEIGQQESVQKLIELLDDIKYPDKFNSAKQNIISTKNNQKHQEDNDGEWIPINKITKLGRQQVCGWETLPSHEIISYNGLKTHNSGKSSAMEETAELYYNEGLNVWHIWGARSYENLFWAVNMNCAKTWEKSLISLTDDEYYKLEGRIHCECHKAYPIMWIVPNYIDFDQDSLDRFNGYNWKNRDEFNEAVANGWISPDITTPDKEKLLAGKLRKPVELHPVQELIKIAPMPVPKNAESKALFKKAYIKAVLEARDERRIVVMNPQIFDGETDKFTMLAEIIRLLPNIADEYFNELDDMEVARRYGLPHPIPKEKWKPREKGWGKILIVLNELRTVAPSNKYLPQKGSSDSKRPIVDTIPELRHLRCWFMGDLQNPDDLNSSVRPQANNVVIKNATRELLGPEWGPFFNTIEYLRQREFEKYGFANIKSVEDERWVPPEYRQVVNRRYPRIEELPKNKGYVVYRNGEFILETFRFPSFHHKKEFEKFRELTKISWKVNEKKLGRAIIDTVENIENAKGSSKKDENKKVLSKAVELFGIHNDLEKVLEELKKLEKSGEIPTTSNSSLTPKALSNKINRDPNLKKKMQEIKLDHKSHKTA